MTRDDLTWAEIRDALHSGDLNLAWRLLTRMNTEEQQSGEVSYLLAEIALIQGRPEFVTLKQQLARLNHPRESLILEQKQALFLGDSRLPHLLQQAQVLFPSDPELSLVQWLYRLDRGEFAWAEENLQRVSHGILFSWQPYQAIFAKACDISHEAALQYGSLLLEQLKPSGYRHQNIRDYLERLEKVHFVPPKLEDEVNLTFAQCGVEHGFYMRDTMGTSIKVALDTGTSSKWFTIHSMEIGEKLTGEILLTQEKAISYNYMPAPADLHTKRVTFAEPPVELPVGYFDGSFTLADGCFSPFAFEGMAITLDPIREEAVMRSPAALCDWLASQPPESWEEIPLIIRDSWMYLPCQINGLEVLMMLETGSSNLNLTKLATEHLNLPIENVLVQWGDDQVPCEIAQAVVQIGGLTYDLVNGTLTWRGHTEQIDPVVSHEGKLYEVRPGLVGDFAMGNGGYGLACAGDIGPFFLQRFAYTIDTCQPRLIIHKR